MSLFRSRATPWISFIGGGSFAMLSIFAIVFTEAARVSLVDYSAHISLALFISLGLFCLGFSGKKIGNHLLGWLLFLSIVLAQFIWLLQYKNGIFIDEGFSSWYGLSMIFIQFLVLPVLLNARFGIILRQSQPPLLAEYINERHAPVRLKWIALAAMVGSALVWLYLALVWFGPQYTFDDGFLNFSARPLMVASTLLFTVGLSWVVQLVPFPDTGRAVALLIQAVLAAIGFIIALFALPSGWPAVLILEFMFLANGVLMGYMAGPIADVEVRFLPGQNHRGEF